ncbi:MAG TPA: hypothetical protein PKZ84_18520 [Anaerolineae bacterium]|nr:hypothetical protein [Anaerolineae bacterium]HQI86595.1 hypothetical protein [Anaerolineae bacterium]
MGTYFRNLYERLKLLLLSCAVFTSDEALRAVFADSRLCAWQHDLPHTHSRERRIVETIYYLHSRYNDDHENGLALLLQVLAESEMANDDLQLTLNDMAERVEFAIHKDNRHLLNAALQGIEFEPVTPLPFAGQVIAGTGDVVITYIDTLTPGESYCLGVIGTSMEHEGIFEGDQVEMRVFNSFEWPNEGDMIVTKYLPYGAEPELGTDFIGSDLLGPTLKVFHQRPNGEFHLGWQKDNTPWTATPWKRFTASGNHQMIVTHYIAPIGKVINVKARRAWDFTALNQRQHRILGGK